MRTIKVTLVDQAYLDDDGNFTALAELSENNIENTSNGDDGYPVSYAKVHWDTLEEWDGEDYGEACNWEQPDGIRFNNEWIADGLSGVNKFKGFKFEIID